MAAPGVAIAVGSSALLIAANGNPIEVGPNLRIMPSGDGHTGDLQEFVSTPTQPGQIVSPEEGGQWVSLGAVDFRALSDEERARIGAPVAGPPSSPQPPGATPPTVVRPPRDDSPPPYAPPRVDVPSVETLPIVEPRPEDSIIEARDSAILAGNMERAGRPRPASGYEAHHIVPSRAGDADMDVLRARMAGWGIDLNSAHNGVWLPGSNAPVGAGGSYHPRLNNEEYRDEIISRFSNVADGPKGRLRAIETLNEIRTELQAGTFPGSRPRPSR